MKMLACQSKFLFSKMTTSHFLTSKNTFLSVLCLLPDGWLSVTSEAVFTQVKQSIVHFVFPCTRECKYCLRPNKCWHAGSVQYFVQALLQVLLLCISWLIVEPVRMRNCAYCISLAKICIANIAKLGPDPHNISCWSRSRIKIFKLF
jgi:hypothetical protein